MSSSKKSAWNGSSKAAKKKKASREYAPVTTIPGAVYESQRGEK